ncbi:hypothetical protein EDD21DRAFT_434460 [Dissophora ornata]|nr:hypothetical protein EDD21DRAFT_434460 [Dissophora ornata]
MPVHMRRIVLQDAVDISTLDACSYYALFASEDLEGSFYYIVARRETPTPVKLYPTTTQVLKNQDLGVHSPRKENLGMTCHSCAQQEPSETMGHEADRPEPKTKPLEPYTAVPTQESLVQGSRVAPNGCHSASIQSRRNLDGLRRTVNVFGNQGALQLWHGNNPTIPGEEEAEPTRGSASATVNADIRPESSSERVFMRQASDGTQTPELLKGLQRSDGKEKGGDVELFEESQNSLSSPPRRAARVIWGSAHQVLAANLFLDLLFERATLRHPNGLNLKI